MLFQIFQDSVYILKVYSQSLGDQVRRYGLPETGKLIDDKVTHRVVSLGHPIEARLHALRGFRQIVLPLLAGNFNNLTPATRQYRFSHVRLLLSLTCPST